MVLDNVIVSPRVIRFKSDTNRQLKHVYSLTILKYILFLLVILDYVPKCSAVKGCLTFMLPDMIYKKSICNNKENEFTIIPRDLPKKLSVLEITNQRISILSSTSFAHLTSLTNLTLDANKISTIHKDTFSQVPKLKFLSLQRNSLKLGNSSFIREALLHLKNLETLILYKNPIGFVPDSFFAPLRSLRVLVLSGAAKNGLQLAENAFEGLPQLEHLDLSNNQLRTLPEGMKHSITQMQLKQFYLFFNPWNCDCNLRWLKVWFLRLGTNIKYSERRTMSDGQTFEMEPVCSSPPRVKDRVILSKVPSPIQLTEFHCKPEIFTKNTNLQVTELSNVTLTCSFRADPKGTVDWYKDGTRVQDHWPRIQYSQTQGTGFKAILTISEIRQSDEGQWMCHLQTNVGQVNATYALSVIQLKSAAFELRRTVMIVGIGIVGLIVMLIIVGILIYCFYGRLYSVGSIYSAGKRRQPRAEGGMPNWGYNQPLNSSASNNNTMYREAMITEEIIGGNSTNEITPRKRVMISRNTACGEIMQHEAVPLTAGLQMEGGGPLETDLSVMQSLESGGTLRVSANPGYVPLQVSCGNRQNIVSGLGSAQSTTSVITATPLPDNCPVHGMGTLRATYSPCPIHGETLSRSQTPQLSMGMSSNPVYGTLTSTSGAAGGAGGSGQYNPYKPCPLHGDMLATMTRKPGSTTTGAITSNSNGPQPQSTANTTNAGGSSTMPPTCMGSACPTRGILRSKSPPKQPRSANNVTVNLDTSSASTAANTAANAAMSTFVRASQVDDCLTDSDAALPQNSVSGVMDNSTSSSRGSSSIPSTNSSLVTVISVNKDVPSASGSNNSNGNNSTAVPVPPRVSSVKSSTVNSSTPQFANDSSATSVGGARHSSVSSKQQSVEPSLSSTSADSSKQRVLHSGKLSSLQNTIVEEEPTAAR